MNEPSIEHRMDVWLAEQVEGAQLSSDEERAMYADAMRTTLAYSVTQLRFAVGDLGDAIKGEVSWLLRRWL